MKRGLQRVLRIRALLEDLARLELESRSAEKRRLEMRAALQRSLSAAARSNALAVLSEAGTADDWMTGYADAEIFGWRGGKLRALAAARKPAVEKARNEFLERRLERRQVQALLTQAAEAEETERTRREQKRLDDWFQSRIARRRRGKK